MADALSQVSGRLSSATTSRFGTRKTYIDGEELSNEFITKAFFYNANIKIQTPQLIKNKVHGDKMVAIRCMYIYDADLCASTVPLSTKQEFLFAVKALNYRNNYDYGGMQSEIVGYGFYDQQRNLYYVDSQFFEQDSIYPVSIEIKKINRSTGAIEDFILSQTSKSYIYADIETTYNYL